MCHFIVNRKTILTFDKNVKNMTTFEYIILIILGALIIFFVFVEIREEYKMRRFIKGMSVNRNTISKKVTDIINEQSESLVNQGYSITPKDHVIDSYNFRYIIMGLNMFYAPKEKNKYTFCQFAREYVPNEFKIEIKNTSCSSPTLVLGDIVTTKKYLEKMILKAVQEERYEDASDYKKKLDNLKNE